MIQAPLSYRLTHNAARYGFALPTILVVSVVMLIVLVASVAAAGSIRTTLDGQYYAQLASEAAESGLKRAESCLRENNLIALWDVQPLRPNTSCSGGAPCTNAPSCYVLQKDAMRVTFEVGAPVQSAASQSVTATGTVQLVRTSSSAGQVWKSYSTTKTMRVGADVSFNTVKFGYTASDGAYFLTIAADGTLRGTGSNSFGQLGNGTTTSSLSPLPYRLPAGERPVGVHTGFLSQGFSAFVTTASGKVFGAGNNAYGQLGDMSAIGRSTPVEMTLPAGVKAITVGILQHSTFVLGSDHSWYSTGRCLNGQLGQGYVVTGCTDRMSLQRVALPAYVAGDPNTHPTAQLASDSASVYTIMAGGRVYGWGANESGQLANGTVTASSSPVKIGTYGDIGKPKAVSVITDGVDVIIVDSNGVAQSAGRNIYGMLGDGTTTQRNTLVPFALPVIAGTAVKASTDNASLVVMTSKGEVWGAGLNNKGQLGDGTTTNRSTPVQFILPVGVKAVDIYNTSSGIPHTWSNTFVVGDNNRVYGAGDNIHGQLGDGTTIDRSTPVVMKSIDGVVIRAQAIQSGYGTTVVLTTDNKIYTVGRNNYGQLGDGTTVNSSTPAANRYTNIIPPTFF